MTLTHLLSLTSTFIDRRYPAGHPTVLSMHTTTALITTQSPHRRGAQPPKQWPFATPRIAPSRLCTKNKLHPVLKSA